MLAQRGRVTPPASNHAPRRVRRRRRRGRVWGEVQTLRVVGRRRRVVRAGRSARECSGGWRGGGQRNGGGGGLVPCAIVVEQRGQQLAARLQLQLSAAGSQCNEWGCSGASRHWRDCTRSLLRLRRRRWRAQTERQRWRLRRCACCCGGNRRLLQHSATPQVRQRRCRRHRPPGRQAPLHLCLDHRHAPLPAGQGGQGRLGRRSVRWREEARLHELLLSHPAAGGLREDEGRGRVHGEGTRALLLMGECPSLSAAAPGRFEPLEASQPVRHTQPAPAPPP